RYYGRGCGEISSNLNEIEFLNSTGSIQALAPALAGTGGSWNKKGLILFTRFIGPVFPVAARLLAAAAEGSLESPPVRRFRGGLPSSITQLRKRTRLSPTLLLMAHLEAKF